MKITYKKKRLEEIRYLEDYKGLPKHILGHYQEACISIESAQNLYDIYSMESYDCTKKKGKLAEVRTLKLNDAYRLFFKVLENGGIEVIHITDVNKHDYKKPQ